MANTPGSVISKSYNGARAIISVDGKTIGTAQNCSFSLNWATDPVFTLGRYEAQELVHNQQTPVTMTLRSVRFFGVSPMTNMRVPQSESADGYGLLNGTEFSVQLIDRQNTGSANKGTIYQVDRCKTTGFTFDNTSGGTAELTINVMGIYQSDETVTNNAGSDTSAAPFAIQ